MGVEPALTVDGVEQISEQLDAVVNVVTERPAQVPHRLWSEWVQTHLLITAVFPDLFCLFPQNSDERHRVLVRGRLRYQSGLGVFSTQ